MAHPYFNSITIETGYRSADGRQIIYTDYTRKPSPELVKDYQNKYNINTNCSSACVNCQITHLNKYPDEDTWAIKAANTVLIKDTDTKEILVKLKRHQQVRVLEKTGNWWKVSATRYTASCFDNPEHKKFASMDKSVFNEKTCAACGSRYVIEINNIVGFLNKDDISAFTVECSYIPKEYRVPEDLKIALSDEERAIAIAALDPSAWSKKFLTRTLRPQQEVALRCSAKYKVLRWGRRVGKSFSQAINILNFVFTQRFSEGKDVNGNEQWRGAKVLILTPFLAQIEMIWSDINDLLDRNPDFAAMRVRDVATPFHQMEFSNGAVIRGFTTGAQSKAEGSSVRGQGADLIYADEVDYMATADLKKAIEPILLTYPHVNLISSSTPKGKREWFYKNCVENPNYKEFYFPSSVLDNWDSIKTSLDITHDSFMQEYMADFIAEEMGVYQPHFVSAAEAQYKYGEVNPFDWYGMKVDVSKPNPAWVYSIGVDWNTNAGTEIAVTGLTPEGTVFVVECINVPKQNWQMMKAERAIFDLHAKWGARFVYVDAGYGVGQIEHMQAISLATGAADPNHPDAAMGQKLHAYDFGKKIQFRDPNTGVIKDTFAKPFLVENSVRHFELGKIIYPSADTVLHNQLLNYIIEHVTTTGSPKYGMIDPKVGDHRLDAVNLALIAYKLELTDFAINSRVTTDVAFSKGFGSDYITRTVITGKEKLIEIQNKIPLDEYGRPAAGLSSFRVQYDPEYIKMKEAEKLISSKDGISRTEKLTQRRDKEVQEFNPAWLTDTEWKCEVGACNHPAHKKPSSQVIKRTLGKPKRRAF